MPRSFTDSHRRILSLWFPRLGAERVLRAEPELSETPLATMAEIGNLRQLVATSAVAEAQGLAPGQSLNEAITLCPNLVTRPADPGREAAFLMALRRWAGKFSPWVAEETRQGLMVDLTGCAHLFGGEAALFDQVHLDCADLGLTLCAGIADTPGAAWALARYGGGGGAGGGGLVPGRNGDAIDQEAHATRSRAQKRHWVKGGPAPSPQTDRTATQRIAPPGRLRQTLGPLPIAALRVPPDITAGLARLGLRRIADVMDLPRASLSRRFGQDLVRRLDQALGAMPEPISPAGAPLHFAVRLSLPEPIGLQDDIAAGLDRLLPVLCDKLRAQGRGARRVALELSRVDGGTERVEIGLARPADRPDKLKPLFVLKLDQIDAGFGIDRLRVLATQTEPTSSKTHTGGMIVAAAHVAQANRATDTQAQTNSTATADLIARLGARVGLDAIHRMRPADSHIPEKTATPLAAAWADPHPPGTWPQSNRPRPAVLFRPEPVHAPDTPMIPEQFRWRGRTFQTQHATGPERIAPEWWFDDPQWRSGVRDYWRVITTDGACLWLFFAHGRDISGGWFIHGDFC